MSDYRDPIIEKVLEALNDNGPSRLKGNYVNGDVLVPGRLSLPLCYVARDTTRVAPASSQEDQHTINMVATVIFSATEGWRDAYDNVAATPELYDLCEGRNTDYSLKSDTLLYVLGNRQQLDAKLWISPPGSDILVNYGLGVERRGPGMFSVEATIRFSVVLHTARPGL